MTVSLWVRDWNSIFFWFMKKKNFLCIHNILMWLIFGKIIRFVCFVCEFWSLKFELNLTVHLYSIVKIAKIIIVYSRFIMWVFVYNIGKMGRSLFFSKLSSKHLNGFSMGIDQLRDVKLSNKSKRDKFVKILITPNSSKGIRGQCRTIFTKWN